VIKGIYRDIRRSKPYRRFRESDDRSRRISAQLVVILANVAAIVHLVWFYRNMNRGVLYVTVPMLVAEVISMISYNLFALVVWYRRFHSPGRLSVKRMHSVDVLIPTAGEALSILEPTIRAACHINYPDFRVYVLDDSKRREVQDLADRYGAIYLSRDDPEHAKAGNLNFGLASSRSDLVMTIDADQVVDPQILSETVGFADLPRVGWVQTRQRFLVPAGDPYSNEDNVFYDVMQRGKDTHNAAFSCGSGVVYRRAALDSVGGFSEWNLVEDVHTSMRLHDKGWRSIYYDHALSTGTTPLETRGMYRQRAQWALDSLRLLFWDSPFTKKGLSLVQKLQYFQIGFTYLVSGFVMPIFLLVPAWSLFTGSFLINTSVWLYAVYRGIYLLVQTLGFFLLNHPSDPGGKAYRQWVGLFPVFMIATFRALGAKNGKPQYKVNRKPEGTEIGRAELAPVTPQILVCLLTIAGAIYSVVTRNLPWTVFTIDVLWGIWVIWSLSSMIRASVVHKKPPTLAV